MLRIGRPLIDPITKPFLLPKRERPMAFSGRHGLIPILAKNPPHEFTLSGLIRANRHFARLRRLNRDRPQIQPQTRLPSRGVWTVTRKTGVGQNRPNFPIKINRRTADCLGQAPAEREQKNQRTGGPYRKSHRAISPFPRDHFPARRRRVFGVAAAFVGAFCGAGTDLGATLWM